MTRVLLGLALCLATRTLAASAPIPVRLDLLGGWWTYTVPAARICMMLRLGHAHTPRYDPVLETQGRTLEGQHLLASQVRGQLAQVLVFNGTIQIGEEFYDVSGPCFTFPPTAPPRRQGHRWKIPRVAYEQICGNGLRFWAKAVPGATMSLDPEEALSLHDLNIMLFEQRTTLTKELGMVCAERDRLAAALGLYGQHVWMPRCPAYDNKPCTCGYAAALSPPAPGAAQPKGD